MQVRLYIDHDVKKDIAIALRTSGYDVLITYEAGNQRLGDAGQLEYAVSHLVALIPTDVWNQRGVGVLKK